MKIFALFTTFTAVFFAFNVKAQHARQKAQAEDRPSYVDIEAFKKLSKEASKVRANRLVNLNTFLKMAEDPNTIVLDTRSQWAFDSIHIKGARHLSFSDFTDEKLKKTLGKNKKVRVLIYCNNNFFSEDNLPGAVATKAVGLALNIPTFINLYGYGYKNVYELGVAVDVDDKRLPLVRKTQK